MTARKTPVKDGTVTPITAARRSRSRKAAQPKPAETKMADSTLAKIDELVGTDKVAERATEARSAKTEKADGSLNLSTGELKVGPAKERVTDVTGAEVKFDNTAKTETKAAKPAKAPKISLVILDEDLAKLVFVNAKQSKPKYRHLDNCPHYEGNGTYKRLADDELTNYKVCPECARNAARSRVAA